MYLPETTRRGFLALWVPAVAATAAEDTPAPSRGFLLAGTDRIPTAAVALRAGPVTCEFEPDIAFLRYIKHGDTELLRGLYAAVRDQVWGTVTPRVSNVNVEAKADSFRLSFDVECAQGDIDFPWKGLITGSPDGTVRFEFHGRARSTFLKNRLGFAVLHPVKECAGKKCLVEKTSGLKEEGHFPAAISPHQPFFDMRAITHEAAPGVNVEVRFEGDIFEMEDHRNWTDGNYKTYCTPLERPFPVEVQRNREIKQAVTIRLKGRAPAAIVRPSAEVEQQVAAHVMSRLPSIGLGVSTHAAPLTAQEAKRIAALGCRHLRVDLRMWEPSWRAAWERATADAKAVGVPLEVAVHVTDDAAAELAQIPSGARVARWIVFHRAEASTSAKWIGVARKHLAGAPVGGGANAYFTELNRGRPDTTAIDFACYSINPQVHAFDNRSLVENLEPQAATVQTARTFLNGRPAVVTPVTLRPRFNPQARQQAEGASEDLKELPGSTDPRQLSLFAAAWTLGSLKYLSESGAASVTYYQTHGWEGVMESAAGSKLAELFPSMPGAVFPLYHVLAAVAPLAGARVLRVDSSEPLHACAMAIESRGLRRVLAANLTAEPRNVAIDAAWLGSRALRSTLDETNYVEASREPEKFRAGRGAVIEALSGRYRLAMAPYSVVRLDAARRSG
jgi:hypothetical protein